MPDLKCLRITVLPNRYFAVEGWEVAAPVPGDPGYATPERAGADLLLEILDKVRAAYLAGRDFVTVAAVGTEIVPDRGGPPFARASPSPSPRPTPEPDPTAYRVSACCGGADCDLRGVDPGKPCWGAVEPDSPGDDDDGFPIPGHLCRGHAGAFEPGYAYTPGPPQSPASASSS